MGKVEGAVFSLPHEAIERLLSGERDVLASFVKFIHLSKGRKIVFYDSVIHAMTGEAIIREVEHNYDCMKIWQKFGARLHLNINEFTDYLEKTRPGPRNTKKRLMSVYVLENPSRYKKSIEPSKKMTTGYYLYI